MFPYIGRPHFICPFIIDGHVGSYQFFFLLLLITAMNIGVKVVFLSNEIVLVKRAVNRMCRRVII